MDEDTFTEKLNTTCSNVGDNINFEEVYKLTIEGLEMFASEDNYGLIVLDPFDIYSLDIDIGDLKEFAKNKNVAILLTTNLARPPIDDNRTHPIVHPSDSTPSDVGATPSDRRCPKYKRKNHKNKTLFSPFWLKTGSYFWFNY